MYHWWKRKTRRIIEINQESNFNKFETRTLKHLVQRWSVHSVSVSYKKFFSTRINEYISIFLEPARDILIKDRGRKKGRSRADRVGTMLSGIRRESTSAEAEKRRGSGGLDPIRSRNNVSRVSNKRLKLNFVECADSPPPLASSPFTPKWILNRAESVRPSIRPKYRRGGSTLGRKWKNGGAERRFFLCFSFSLFLSCVIS